MGCCIAVAWYTIATRYHTPVAPRPPRALHLLPLTYGGRNNQVLLHNKSLYPSMRVYKPTLRILTPTYNIIIIEYVLVGRRGKVYDYYYKIITVMRPSMAKTNTPTRIYGEFWVQQWLPGFSGGSYSPVQLRAATKLPWHDDALRTRNIRFWPLKAIRDSYTTVRSAR